MMTETTREYESMAAIRRANAEHGHHFFEREAMRFFLSRIESRSPIGGRYFITSEQFEFRGERAPRRYTVRMAKSDGSIDTVGEFQQYGTRAEASAAAIQLAHGK